MAPERSSVCTFSRSALLGTLLILVSALVSSPAQGDEGGTDAATTWERLRATASPAQIAEALAPLGESGRDVLRRELGSIDPADRRLAADVLGRLGTPDEATVIGLADAIHDDVAEVRRASALALARIAPADSEARDALASRMTDQDDGVRLAVHLARLRCAPSDSGARRDILLAPGAPVSLAPLLSDSRDLVVALVRELLGHPSWRVRARALVEEEALLAHEAMGAEEVMADAVRLFLEDASPLVRRQAGATLCRRARDGADVPFHRLVPVLRDPAADTRVLVLSLLAWRPEAAGASVPDLLRCLVVDDVAERRLAALALRERREADVVAALRTRLDDHDPSVRLSSVVALAEADEPNPRVAELLAAGVLDTGSWQEADGPIVLQLSRLSAGGRHLAGTCEPPLRRLVSAALAHLGSAAAPALVALASDEDPMRRLGALVLLDRALPAESPDALAAFLTDQDRSIRIAAAALLAARGILDDRTAAPLLEALGDEEYGAYGVIQPSALDPLGTARLAWERAGTQGVPYLLEAARADLEVRLSRAVPPVVPRRLDEIAQLIRNIDGECPAIEAEAATTSALARWLRENGLAPR